MMNWMALILLATSLVTGIIGYLFWIMLKNMNIYLEKSLLRVSLCLAMIACCVAISYANQASDAETKHPAMQGIFTSSELSRLSWIILIYAAVILACLLLSVSSDRKQSYFWMGMILLVLTFLLAVKSASNLRFARQPL